MPQEVGKMVINRFTSECHATSMPHVGSDLTDLDGPVARFLLIAIDSNIQPDKHARRRIPKPNRKLT